MGRIEDELQAIKESMARKDAQIDTLIAALTAKVGAPPVLTEDEKVIKLTEDLKGKDRPKHRERRLPSTSHRTGASFTLRVIESRGSPEGRIVELLDYLEPAGFDVNVRDGGLVPDGMIINHPKSGDETLEYRVWKYTTFWNADLREYTGRLLSRRDLNNPDDIKMPWATFESYTQAKSDDSDKAA